MDIAVPSRFACLTLEEDEAVPTTNRPSTKRKIEKNQKKAPTVAANNLNKKTTSTKQIPTSGQSKKNKSKARHEDAQWEDWKKKDDELVNDNYEQDLKCAIFQSQLESEHNRSKESKINRPQQQQADSQKKKKSKTMSLDQFLTPPTTNGKDNIEKAEEKDVDFFDKADESAKQQITKEKVERKRKEREVNIEEVITLAQCQERLEIERSKNAALQKELEKARKEIAVVKKRNSTLCSMLSQGEMKDKVEVLKELERLTLDKEELTEEVGKLHKLLEQERSKVSGGASESHNAKSKDKQKHKKK